MTAHLIEYERIFDVPRFPPGHVIQACEGISRHARHFELPELVRLAAAARASAIRYIERKARRRIQRMAGEAGGIQVVDTRIAGRYGQIHDLLANEAATGCDRQRRALAAEVLTRLYPRGRAGAVELPFEEQLAFDEYRAALLRARYPQAAARLGFEELLVEIEALLPAYRRPTAVETVSAIEVGEAYAAMQVALLRVVGWIMALVYDADRRARLMAPLNDQVGLLTRRDGEPGVEDGVDPPAQLELDPYGLAVGRAGSTA